MKCGRQSEKAKLMPPTSWLPRAKLEVQQSRVTDIGPDRVKMFENVVGVYLYTLRSATNEQIKIILSEGLLRYK